VSTARHGEQSAFERIGGRDGLRRLAVRFYEIMEARPDAAGIRAMHKSDLGPIAASLAEFLMGALPISASERDQWLACMKQAMEETVSDEALRAELEPAFFRIADAMRSR
jgi:hemoglobin